MALFRTTTHMPNEIITVQSYSIGDISSVNCSEPDPWSGWAASIEACSTKLASVYRGAELIGVIGFTTLWNGVAEGFAVFDRNKAAGAGKPLAKTVQGQIDLWMTEHQLHRVQATSDVSDKAGQVFLRAVGYRFESVMSAANPDKTDLLMFVIRR